MSSEVFSHGWGEKRNNRKFPGMTGKRPDRKDMRRQEAFARNAAYAKLPLIEKVKRNPNKYTDAQRASAYGMV